MIESIYDLLPGKHAVFYRWPGLHEDGITTGGGMGILELGKNGAVIRLFVHWEYSKNSVASYDSRTKAERAAVEACADVPTGMHRYIVDGSLSPTVPGFLTDLGVAP